MVSLWWSLASESACVPLTWHAIIALLLVVAGTVAVVHSSSSVDAGAHIHSLAEKRRDLQRPTIHQRFHVACCRSKTIPERIQGQANTIISLIPGLRRTYTHGRRMQPIYSWLGA